LFHKVELIGIASSEAPRTRRETGRLPYLGPSSWWPSGVCRSAPAAKWVRHELGPEGSTSVRYGTAACAVCCAGGAKNPPLRSLRWLVAGRMGHMGRRVRGLLGVPLPC